MTDGRNPAPRPTAGVIPRVLEQHLEALQFLWAQRRQAVEDSEWQLQDLQTCDRRIAAHLDGLRLAGAAAVPLFESRLAADDPDAVFVAAHLLLGLADPAAGIAVVSALRKAEEGQREGIGAALRVGPIDCVQPQLMEQFAEGPALASACAAEALAAHGRLDLRSDRMAALLRDEDPQVRQTVWRCHQLQAS